MAEGLVEKRGGVVEEQGMLFEYTVKLLLLTGFLELILYRLVSRLALPRGRWPKRSGPAGIPLKDWPPMGSDPPTLFSFRAFWAFFFFLFIRSGPFGSDRYVA